MNVEVKPAATSYKLLIEKDVDVPMRDGARLKADVFRPDDGTIAFRELKDSHS